MTSDGNPWDHPDWDDSPEWTEEDFKKAMTPEQLWGPEYKNFLVRKPGRPPLDPAERKQNVSVRLSPDVLIALRATGRNWQRRMDEALRAAFVEKTP